VHCPGWYASGRPFAMVWAMQVYQAWLDQQKLNKGFRQLASCPRGLLDFSHNDYLGLSQHPALIEAASRATHDHGTSVSSSPLVCGHGTLAQQLTQALAQWTQAPHALVYGSGYQLNQSVLCALGQLPDVHFLMDKACHASLIDGVRASGARWHRFRHNDMAHLHILLQRVRQQHPKAPVWVITESVFSMRGDLCPLADITRICQAFDALLYLDEAHACGMYGSTRFSGLAEATRQTNAITLRMGTFSKAMGSFGAWLVAHNKLWTNYLINASRGLIYSTGLPPGVLAASLAAIQVVQTEPGHRQALGSLIGQLRQTSQPLHPDNLNSSSPIVPVVMPDNVACLAMADNLARQGYWVKAIRPPTVSVPQLRLTMSALHNPKTASQLMMIINKAT
jgi:8-amino-7-oxononanoate synthase